MGKGESESLIEQTSETPELDKSKNVFNALIFAWVALTLADALTTKYGLSLSPLVYEKFSASKSLITELGIDAGMAVKICIATLPMLLASTGFRAVMKHFKSDHPHVIDVPLALFDAAYAGVVINNLIVISKIQ